MSRTSSAGWLNPAARPYFRPSSVYFNNMYWPELYDPMYMNEGRWGTAVKTSAGSSQTWLGSLKCTNVVAAGNIIQTVQAGLRQAYESIASATIACTARQMVFSSPWLTAKKESGSPLQTALVCNSNPLMVARLPKTGCPEQTATGKDMLNPLYGCDGLPKTVRVFQFTLDSRSEKLDWFLLHQVYGSTVFMVATSFDSAVHRVHAVSFDAAVLDVASTIVAAGYIVSAGICDAAEFMLEDLEAVPADYVPADLIYRRDYCMQEL
ncbi:hypothetical protein Tco_0362904 [Tanacetum coccineum]